jgi:hypothetical protein
MRQSIILVVCCVKFDKNMFFIWWQMDIDLVGLAILFNAHSKIVIYANKVFLPNIIRAVKSKRIRLAGHVVSMGDTKIT